MDDLGDKLNAILGDPKQLERIAGMARSIMGGEPAQDSGPRRDEEPLIDPAMLKKLGAVMKGGGSDKHRLLEAMGPYLSEKRRKKMSRALKLAKLASFAELAVQEFGEDGDV